MAEPSVYEVVQRLVPGQRIELTHEVKVGFRRWMTSVDGTVLKVDRRRHGLHYRRNHDDKVFSDVIVLRRDDGEETTVTIDEFTQVKVLSTAGDSEPKN